MKPSGFTDEYLMAFADGELPPDEALRVAEAVRADPDVAARVSTFTRTREALARHAPPQEVPQAMIDRVRQLAAADRDANVVAFPERRGFSRWQLPLAAGIALAVGVAAGYLGGRQPEAPRGPGLRVAGLADPAVADALTRVGSGSRAALGDNASFTAIASFANARGEICREFEYDGAAGGTLISVACHAGQDWEVRFLVAAPGGGDGFAPASSLETLDAYLGAIGAQAPMSAEEEAAALSRLR